MLKCLVEIRRVVPPVPPIIRSTRSDFSDARLAQIQRRMDQAYQDKLDGKISEEFWTRKSAEWQVEETQIRESIQALETARPDRLLDAARILELANKAYFLYVKQAHPERAKLLRMVLSNCGVDAVSLYPTYRKPFNLIFQTNKRRNGAPGEIRTPDPLVRSLRAGNSKCLVWRRLRTKRVVLTYPVCPYVRRTCR